MVQFIKTHALNCGNYEDLSSQVNNAGFRNTRGEPFTAHSLALFALAYKCNLDLLRAQAAREAARQQKSRPAQSELPLEPFVPTTTISTETAANIIHVMRWNIPDDKKMKIINIITS